MHVRINASLARARSPLPPGEWQRARLEFSDFIFTFRGRLVSSQAPLTASPRMNVMAVGVTLAASDDMPAEGDFRWGH